MEFSNLAGKIVLGTAYSKDYTDWAEDMLDRGSDSESVVILASLGLDKYPDTEEIKSYFFKSLKELNLELPIKENSILSYATFICSEMVKGNISPMSGLSTLEEFYSTSDFEPIYCIWDELSEDVWMVKNQGGCIFNTGLTQDNIDKYIINVAEQFIKLSQIELPENFFKLSTCPKCAYIGESKLERIDLPWLPEKVFRFIIRRGPTWRSICSNCKTPYPLGMGDYEGRKHYLKSKCQPGF